MHLANFIWQSTSLFAATDVFTLSLFKPSKYQMLHFAAFMGRIIDIRPMLRKTFYLSLCREVCDDSELISGSLRLYSSNLRPQSKYQWQCSIWVTICHIHAISYSPPSSLKRSRSFVCLCGSSSQGKDAAQGRNKWLHALHAVGQTRAQHW